MPFPESSLSRSSKGESAPQTDFVSPSASSVNGGITAMILAFVALSLAASVLPLWPGIQKILPFEFLSRDRAMGGYALALLGFMALLFPLFVRKPAQSRSILAWWWVGGYAIAFAGVPLFLLAWIAGVHRNGVIAIVLWAAVFQGGVLLLLRAFRYRQRALIVAIGGMFAFAFPLIDYFEDLLGEKAARFDWAPFSKVLAITYDLTPASLLTPGLAFLAVQAGLWFTRERGPRVRSDSDSKGRSQKTALGLLIVIAGALGLAFYGSEIVFSSTGKGAIQDNLRLVLPSGNRFVPGGSYPLGLSNDSGLEQLRVEVAGREFWSFDASASFSGSTTWIYPRLLEAGETIVISDQNGHQLRVLTPQPTAGLVLIVDRAASPEAGAKFESVLINHENLPDSSYGFDPFTDVWIAEAVWRALPETSREALGDWVALGGQVHRLGAGTSRREIWGSGYYALHADSNPPILSQMRSLQFDALSSNLYSNFALPNWGRVDLDSVLIFLFVYHLLFALIFMLPLCLDRKKSLSVYLVSVGFVLAIVVVGAHFALKKIFFTDTQILQQSLEVMVARGRGEGSVLQRDELACFASFNGAPGALSFDRAFRPRPLFENRSQGPGPVRMQRDVLQFENVRLDRFRRKQIFQLRHLEASPFSWQREGRDLVLKPILGQEDSAEFWAAAPQAAFARIDGRLHRAHFAGGRLTVKEQADPSSWRGVLPEAIRLENGIPFLRYALGRYAPRTQDVAIILLSGVPGLHRGKGYLMNRDVIRLVILPYSDG